MRLGVAPRLTTDYRWPGPSSNTSINESRTHAVRDSLSRVNRVSASMPGVRNLHVSVKKRADQVIFLRKVAPAALDRSLWHRSGATAGLPVSVIERAREYSSAAREIRASGHRGAGAASFHGSPDSNVRAGELRNRRAHPQFETWMNCGPSKRCNLLNELQRELKR